MADIHKGPEDESVSGVPGEPDINLKFTSERDNQRVLDHMLEDWNKKNTQGVRSDAAEHETIALFGSMVLHKLMLNGFWEHYEIQHNRRTFAAGIFKVRCAVQIGDKLTWLSQAIPGWEIMQFLGNLEDLAELFVAKFSSPLDSKSSEPV